jgi:ABC-type multidrug transport system ATPase subunit
MTLHLPELSLVLLIGPSGAGKSTFARCHFLSTEIISSDILRVRRPNRDFLLEIRSGRHSYDEVVAHAESLHAGLTDRFASFPLPNAPDRGAATTQLIEIRSGFR